MDIFIINNFIRSSFIVTTWKEVIGMRETDTLVGPLEEWERQICRLIKRSHSHILAPSTEASMLFIFLTRYDYFNLLKRSL